MRALLLLALVVVAYADDAIITRLNKIRREFAEKHNITNMREVVKSDKLEAIVKSMTCNDLKSHGPNYRVFVEARNGSDHYKDVMGKTSMYSYGALDASIQTIRRIAFPFPNNLEMYVPAQREAACAQKRCSADFFGKPLHVVGICLLGPYNVLSSYQFQVNNKNLSDVDKSAMMVTVLSYRQQISEKLKITNMNKLIYSNKYVEKAAEVAKSCDNHPLESDSRIIEPSTVIKKDLQKKYFSGDSSPKKFIELVQEVAGFTEHVPNVINYVHPKQEFIGCAPANCPEWKAGGWILKGVKSVCVIGPHGKASPEDFKFENYKYVPPTSAPAPVEVTPEPKVEPEAEKPAEPAPEPKKTQPEEVKPKKAAPLTDSKDNEEEDPMGEDEEDLEESASTFSYFFSLIVAALLIWK